MSEQNAEKSYIVHNLSDNDVTQEADGSLTYRGEKLKEYGFGDMDAFLEYLGQKEYFIYERADVNIFGGSSKWVSDNSKITANNS